jgi:hypothetical protein
MKVLLHPGAKIVKTVPEPPRGKERERREEGGKRRGGERKRR